MPEHDQVINFYASILVVVCACLCEHWIDVPVNLNIWLDYSTILAK